ncbi:MAG: hypothetical protein B7C55_14755 [Actinomycetales bacterium mxb001]|nr:MAG: hypothetical protein B7C55_14755 [Actinomycetales bacterium mxb001]
MEITGGVLATIIVAIAVAAIARWRGVGIAIPLLVVGAIIGALPFGPVAPDDAGEVFLLILAPLIFGEAMSTSFFDFRRQRGPILALAIGLVVLSSFAVGAVAQWIMPGLSLSLAFALGAVLSPTDAVAVASVARRGALPRRIVTILEGESLVNDGTGLTLLRVALTAAALGAVTVGDVLLILTLSIVGGLIVGIAIGLIIVWVMRTVRDDLIANCLILIAPFPSYLIAEEIGGSGILAVVATALLVANAMLSNRRFRGRMASVAVWRQLTFILTAFAFFLVGLEIPATLIALAPGELRIVILLVVAVLAVLFVSRLLFVFAMVGLSHLGSRERLGPREAIVLAWAGARGPVSGLAAFSIPAAAIATEFADEHRILLATTFCVIAITLLLSPTLSLVARLVGVHGDDEGERAAALKAALVARGLEALDQAVEQGIIDGQPIDAAAERSVRDTLTSLMPASQSASESESADQVWQLEGRVLRAQYEELLRLRDEEGMPDAIVRPVMHALDLQSEAHKGRQSP